MNIEIIRQMQELRLDGMIHEFEQQCTTQESLGLSFNTRLLGLLNAEATYKSNKRLQMLLKKARLKELASVHSIDYSGGRKLSRDRVSVKRGWLARWVTKPVYKDSPCYLKRCVFYWKSCKPQR